MKFLKNKTFIYLFLIIILGAVLRFYTLTSLPLYGDELTITYDAYSLLHTGKDQTGESWPVTFAMGAGRPAGFVYATIPFIAILGPNELGVRLLSVLSGIGLIILIFFLGKELFSRNIGLIASFLVSISIWDLSLSRGGFEAHMALLTAVLAIYFLLRSLKKPSFLLLSAIFFGLTIHTYPTYKLTLPLIVITIMFYLGKKIRIWFGDYKWYSLFSIFIVGIFVLISVTQTLYFGSEGRFSNINFLSQQKLKEEVTQKVNFERTADAISSNLSPFLHNKWLEYTGIYTNAYLENLSPKFLFVSGDGNPRHNMSGFGAFYYIEALLFILGCFYLIKNSQNKQLVLLISWILIIPLATALLLTPHFLRNSFLIVPVLLIVANGLYFVWNFKNRWAYVLKTMIVLGFLLQFIIFADRFYFLSPQIYGDFWSQNAKTASEKAFVDSQNYDVIFLSNNIDNIEYAYPVYNQIDPAIVIAQNQNPNKDSQILKKFDNVYIGDKSIIDISNEFSNKKVLYMEIDKSPDKLGQLKFSVLNNK